MRANRPVASAKAKPRTAYEKSWPAIDETRSAYCELCMTGGKANEPGDGRKNKKEQTKKGKEKE